MLTRVKSFRLVALLLVIAAFAAAGLAIAASASPLIASITSTFFTGKTAPANPVRKSARRWDSSSFLVNIAYEPFLGPLTSGTATSTQDFGTGTGSQTSQTGVNSFIPNPTSGTTWARGGATAPGAPIVLATASNPLGTTGAYVRGVAATSTSVAKFSPWVGYSSGTEFYTSFKVLFGDSSAGNTAASGIWSFNQGSGAMYSDNNDFTGAQCFTRLLFTYGASGAISLSYRNGSTASSTTGLTATSFNQATVYTVEIVGNNKSSGTINYAYNGVAQSVAVQKFDLYINGTQVGNDLSEATLPAGNVIDSADFHGASSTSNVANIFVDDVVTYNAVPAGIGPVPTVTNLNPTHGPTAGANSVIITGTGFTGVTGVTFGGTAAPFVFNSDTQITATAPQHAGGAVDVAVTTLSGTNTNTANDDYTYDAPTVSNVVPNNGSVLGGTSVTINGNNFRGQTGVTFNGAAATSVTFVGDTQITANTPAGSAGSASVIVTTSGGTNAPNSAYTYTNTNPTISDIANQSITAGNMLTIPFTVGDVETAPGSLTLNEDSNSQAVLPDANITFGGSGAARTVTIAPIAAGTATVNITVNDAHGGSASDSFVVTVNAAICTPPPAGLVAWYDGSGTAPNTRDLIAANNGTFQGGTAFGAGKVGQGLQFNGTNAFVEAPSTAAIDLTSTGTLEAWVKLDQLPSAAGHIMTIVDKSTILPSGTMTFIVGQNDRFAVYLGNNVSLETATVAQTGVWYHFVATFDTTSIRLYINGVNDNNSGPPAVRVPNNAPLRIGQVSSDFASRLFNGTIDEVGIYNRALTATEIAKIYNASSAGKCPDCATQPSGMVSWWKGEDNALDTRGMNNGTLQNGAAFGSGEVGRAFNFNGSNQYVSVPDSTSMRPQTLTVDAWTYPRSVGNINDSTGPVIFTKDIANVSGSPVSYAIFGPGSTGKFSVFVRGTDNTYTGGMTTATFSFNQWYHVAMTFDGSLLRLYINGNIEFSENLGPRTIPYTTESAAIGRHINGDRAFDGLIDEVEIFSRALTQSEVQGIYNAGSLGKCTCTGLNGPLGWWPGDGDFRDISGNNLNGTPFNNPGFGAGEVSQAFSMNGTNQNIVIGDPVPVPLQIQNEISLESWIYITGYPSACFGCQELGMIVGSQYDPNFAGASIFIDGRVNPDGQTAPAGHIHFQIGDGNPSWHVTNSNSQVPLNQWVHIVATRKANEAGKIYYNGVLQPSTSAPWSGAISYNGSWFAIGQQKGIVRPFNGLIDEPAIYNRAITASEALSTTNAGLAGRYKSATTGTGASVATNVGSDATVSFPSVTTAGTTQQVALDLSLYPALPATHTSIGLTYDISTAAAYSGNPTVCFNLPLVTTLPAFNRIRIDHLEGGIWVNRTASIDFPTRTVCTPALSSLSPFAIVQLNTPTAAGVSVSGRVTDAVGRGIRNAVIYVVDGGLGQPIAVTTGALGYYEIDDLTVGRTYVMTVSSKRFRFGQPSRIVTLSDRIVGLDWVAEPQE